MPDDTDCQIKYKLIHLAATDVTPGHPAASRAKATAKLWRYVKDNGCQNPQNKREIVADTKLQSVFGGSANATMFEVPKHLNRHLT
jgi:chromatin remodeling complex protein RSC6